MVDPARSLSNPSHGRRLTALEIDRGAGWGHDVQVDAGLRAAAACAYLGIKLTP